MLQESLRLNYVLLQIAQTCADIYFCINSIHVFRYEIANRSILLFISFVLLVINLIKMVNIIATTVIVILTVLIGYVAPCR